MISLCSPPEIAWTDIVVVALFLPSTSDLWGDRKRSSNTLQRYSVPLHIFMFFPTHLARIGTMSAPPHPSPPPPLHSLEWNLNCQHSKLSMKGQLFPALCRPAQASVRCLPRCSTPPQMHAHSHRQLRLVWKHEMPLPAGVRFRGHSTKLCPHCKRKDVVRNLCATC